MAPLFKVKPPIKAFPTLPVLPYLSTWAMYEPNLIQTVALNHAASTTGKFNLSAVVNGNPGEGVSMTRT